MGSEEATRLESFKPFYKVDWIVAAILAMVAFGLYVRTLAPDVLFGDGGEFQVLSATLGLAHTTGYPLYILLGKLATFLPFGSIAYRVDLLSAIMGGLTIAEVYLLGRALSVRRVFCALGALAVSMNPLIWWQSVIAKPHIITAPFFLALVICALLWQRNRNPRILGVAGALGGLCLGLHHIVILIAPAAAVFLWAAKARRADWKMAGAGVLLGCAISLAAYMAMASMDNVTTATNSIRPSLTAFGMQPSEFDSPLHRISFDFFSKQYQGQLTSLDLAELSKNLHVGKQRVVGDFGWPLLLISLVGVGFLFSKGRSQAVLILGSLLLMLAFAVKFTIFDLEEHFVLPYLIIGVCMALGLQALQGLVPSRLTSRMPVRFASGLLAFALLMLGGWTTWSNAADALQAGNPTFLTRDRRQVPFPVDSPDSPHMIANSIVSNVPDGSVILTTWDWEWPIYYVAQFEANKPHIRAIELLPQGTYVPGVTTSLTPSMTQFINDSLKNGPVFETRPHSLLANYDQMPIIPADSGGDGLFQLLPRSSP